MDIMHCTLAIVQDIPLFAYTPLLFLYMYIVHVHAHLLCRPFSQCLPRHPDDGEWRFSGLVVCHQRTATEDWQRYHRRKVRTMYM